MLCCLCPSSFKCKVCHSLSSGCPAPEHVLGGSTGTEANDTYEDARTAAVGDRVLGLMEPLLTQTP